MRRSTSRLTIATFVSGALSARMYSQLAAPCKSKKVCLSAKKDNQFYKY